MVGIYRYREIRTKGKTIAVLYYSPTIRLSDGPPRTVDGGCTVRFARGTTNRHRGRAVNQRVLPRLAETPLPLVAGICVAKTRKPALLVQSSLASVGVCRAASALGSGANNVPIRQTRCRRSWVGAVLNWSCARRENPRRRWLGDRASADSTSESAGFAAPGCGQRRFQVRFDARQIGPRIHAGAEPLLGGHGKTLLRLSFRASGHFACDRRLRTLVDRCNR